jgi:predicted dehydrogenase
MAGLGFGLIGTGFMGRAHAIALAEVAAVYDDIAKPRAVCVADVSEESAARAAEALRFEQGSSDWRRLVANPEVDVVDVCTPNHLHYEMALAALEAGKHVYCEKPLALTVAEAERLARAARRAGVVHGVGLNYTTNPMIRTAREIVASGEIGEVLHFSGRYFEDYMASPDVPFSWRCERRLAGSGALADLGSHLINLVHFLLGRPHAVTAETITAIRERRGPDGKMRTVENEDVARAFLTLGSGAAATLEISRIATGRKCGLAFDLFGTRGALRFDQERMNELELYTAGDAPGRSGYRTLLAGPAHGDYARFCPAPGHGLGINDLKVIEMHDFIRAVERGERFYPDFDEGLAVQRVMQAIEDAAAARCPVALDWGAQAT